MKKSTLGPFYLFIFAYIALQASLFQLNEQVDFYSLYFKFIITVTLFFLLVNLDKANPNKYEHKYLLSGFFFLFLTMLTNTLNELFIQPWLITSLFEDLGQAIGFVLIFHAINRWTTQKSEQRNEFDKRVEIDELTALYSRQYFNGLLAKKVVTQQSEAPPFSLLLINIDNCQTANTKYGQSGGDIVLKRIANKLRDCIGKTDIVARWQGDEFIVLLTGSNEVSSLQMAEMMRESIELLCIEFNQDILNVTVSIGAVTYRNGLDSINLINEVEQALSEAKRSGKNRVLTPQKKTKKTSFDIKLDIER